MMADARYECRKCEGEDRHTFWLSLNQYSTNVDNGLILVISINLPVIVHHSALYSIYLTYRYNIVIVLFIVIIVTGYVRIRKYYKNFFFAFAWMPSLSTVYRYNN